MSDAVLTVFFFAMLFTPCCIAAVTLHKNREVTLDDSSSARSIIIAENRLATLCRQPAPLNRIALIEKLTSRPITESDSLGFSSPICAYRKLHQLRQLARRYTLCPLRGIP
jgi:hypothetical protein